MPSQINAAPFFGQPWAYQIAWGRMFRRVEQWAKADQIEKACTQLASFFMGHNLTLRDEELVDLISELHEIETEEDLDWWLEDLYNWADNARVWLDPTGAL